ncbi:MAG: hypothetical protein ACOYUZ_06610 [Patescibacteria group bacterium]
MDAIWSNDVPYQKRQVWAAWAKVPVEICLRCPFFKPVQGGGKNRSGQPGTCCFGRAEEDVNKMTGQPMCMR